MGAGHVDFWLSQLVKKISLIILFIILKDIYLRLFTLFTLDMKRGKQGFFLLRNAEYIFLARLSRLFCSGSLLGI